MGALFPQLLHVPFVIVNFSDSPFIQLSYIMSLISTIIIFNERNKWELKHSLLLLPFTSSNGYKKELQCFLYDEVKSNGRIMRFYVVDWREWQQLRLSGVPFGMTAGSRSRHLRLKKESTRAPLYPIMVSQYSLCFIRMTPFAPIPLSFNINY